MSLVSSQIKQDLIAAMSLFISRIDDKVDLAEQYKQEANTSSQLAGQKANQAILASEQAISEAAEAIASALLSYRWANNPEDVAVRDNEFSAYHHRRKAEMAAQEALTALGQFGIGAAAMPVLSTNLNLQLAGGLFVTQSVGMTGLPPGWSQDKHTVIVSGSANQLIIAANTSPDVGKMAFRSYDRDTSTWGSWFEVWTTQGLKLQTSAIDATAGSALLTGAGGLVVGPALDAGAGNINANDLGLGTVHRYETTEAGAVAFNLPTLGSTGSTPRHWIVSTFGISNRKQQQAVEVFGTSTTKGRTFVRVWQDNSWSSWKYLWDSDNLVKQTSANDATSGRMLAVGAGGLLGNAITWSGANSANAINYTGWFAVVTGMTNLPAEATPGSILLNVQFDANNQSQEIFCKDVDLKFYRRRNNGTWGSWVKMFLSTSPISDHSELASKLDLMSIQLALTI